MFQYSREADDTVLHQQSQRQVDRKMYSPFHSHFGDGLLSFLDDSSQMNGKSTNSCKPILGRGNLDQCKSGSIAQGFVEEEFGPGGNAGTCRGDNLASTVPNGFNHASCTGFDRAYMDSAHGNQITDNRLAANVGVALPNSLTQTPASIGRLVSPSSQETSTYPGMEGCTSQDFVDSIWSVPKGSTPEVLPNCTDLSSSTLYWDQFEQSADVSSPGQYNFTTSSGSFPMRSDADCFVPRDAVDHFSDVTQGDMQEHRTFQSGFPSVREPNGFYSEGNTKHTDYPGTPWSEWSEDDHSSDDFAFNLSSRLANLVDPASIYNAREDDTNNSGWDLVDKRLSLPWNPIRSVVRRSSIASIISSGEEGSPSNKNLNERKMMKHLAEMFIESCGDTIVSRSSTMEGRRGMGEVKFCVFCRKNKERREFFTTHVLKDANGRVICPVLRNYVCPKCKATGNNAHTLGHCPFRVTLGGL